jgi:glycoprotein-N-acetylgalactosamine 3-beta-galactosyltransferase
MAVLLVLVLYPLLPLFEIPHLQSLLCGSRENGEIEFTVILGHPDHNHLDDSIIRCLKKDPITIPHLSFPKEIGRSILSQNDARIALLYQDASLISGLDILAQLITNADLVLVGQILENPDFLFLRYLRDVVPNRPLWLIFSSQGLTRILTETRGGNSSSILIKDEMKMYLEYVLPYSGIGSKGDSFLSFKSQLSQRRHFSRQISTCSPHTDNSTSDSNSSNSMRCQWRRRSSQGGDLLQKKDRDFLIDLSTALQRRSPLFSDTPSASMECLTLFESEGRLVLESLQNHSKSSKKRESEMFLLQSSHRILCLVYTTHANRSEPLQAVIETWARRCDGFIAFSDLTDESWGTISMTDASQMLKRGRRFAHREQPLSEDGSPSEPWVESYHKMWNKVQVMWSMIATSDLIDHYDYFFIGGDDVYLLSKNLRHLLRSSVVKEAEGPDRMKPIYLGRQLRTNAFAVFNSGGSGYVLNRVAVATLSDLISPHSSLPSPCLTDKSSSMEDLLVGRCLYEAGIRPLSSTSEVDGRETFHPLSPDHMAAIDPPEWFQRMAVSYGSGLDCCSRESVSFHYLSPSQIRCIDQLISY